MATGQRLAEREIRKRLLVLEGRTHRTLLAAELAELSRPRLWLGEWRRHARLWKRTLPLAAPVAGWLAAKLGRRRRQSVGRDRFEPARLLRLLEWAGPLALWWLKQRQTAPALTARPREIRE